MSRDWLLADEDFQRLGGDAHIVPGEANSADDAGRTRSMMIYRRALMLAALQSYGERTSSFRHGLSARGRREQFIERCRRRP